MKYGLLPLTPEEKLLAKKLEVLQEKIETGFMPFVWGLVISILAILAMMSAINREASDQMISWAIIGSVSAGFISGLIAEIAYYQPRRRRAQMELHAVLADPIIPGLHAKLQELTQLNGALLDDYEPVLRILNQSY